MAGSSIKGLHRAPGDGSYPGSRPSQWPGCRRLQGCISSRKPETRNRRMRHRVFHIAEAQRHKDQHPRGMKHRAEGSRADCQGSETAFSDASRTCGDIPQRTDGCLTGRLLARGSPLCDETADRVNGDPCSERSESQSWGNAFKPDCASSGLRGELELPGRPSHEQPIAKIDRQQRDGKCADRCDDADPSSIQR
jgi:hypothetical protein